MVLRQRNDELLKRAPNQEFRLSGLARWDPGQVSRLVKRRRTHGLIKNIDRTDEYYLTALGLKLKHATSFPNAPSSIPTESLARYGQDLLIAARISHR